jgi:type VI secretion system protein ImpA
MPPPPLLDFAALTAPIPGADPAGVFDRDLRTQFRELRVEQEDPAAPGSTRGPDWKGILRLGQETLAKTSKDLQIAAHLVEALVKEHGFVGLRDGLGLMRRLVDEAWDRVHPKIEEGDVEVRAAPFNWLNDADRGALFPNTVRLAPLVRGEERAYSWHDWRQSQDGAGEVSREEFEKAIAASTLEHWEELSATLDEGLSELHRLTRLLQEKMGPAAPGLNVLQEAVEDCRRLVQQILLRKRPEPASETDQKEEGVGDGAPRKGTPQTTRAEAYRQLAQAAAVLRELEPHSPIPYLVQRAVELGALPFPQLMKALIRDAGVLSELNRELGISEEPAAGE